VPIQSCGVFIYYIYPGAFVNVPDQYLLLLSPFRQLKIICAGIWHNLILYGFTLVLLGGGLKAMLETGGWQSLEGNGGVSVVQVRSQSPMAPHLPISSVIYQLDDTELEHNIIDWNSFLLDPQGRENPHPGFCAVVNKGDDDASPPPSLACCEIDDQYPFGKALNVSISCFQDFDSTIVEKVSFTNVTGDRRTDFCVLDPGPLIVPTDYSSAWNKTSRKM
jgi:S2P endopeptidase